MATVTAPPAVSVATAQTQNPATAGISIPITVPNFAGTFTITRFAVVDGVVNAIGRLAGTYTAPGTTDPIAIVRSVSVPVMPAQTTATCEILHLELGPLDLNLLGLVVHLDRIVLDIDAQSGPGALLGNLLCSVAGLLDNPGGLARLLNQILGILG
jgi:hypothetical protein